MKLFSHYLKDRLFFIMIYVVSVLICLCVFKLYNLELEAFTYAFMCFVGGLFLLGLLQIL